jgi:phospholipase C
LRIFQAVSQSPKWQDTLLIITYDEHGGTYDHVLPPTGAVPPDQASSPGQYGFGFDRFGVRVPTLLVSPWIEKGTVFRSNTSTPLDHTSILSTLRDWLEIQPETMLPSKRAVQAPTLEYVLTRKTPRTDLPTFPPVGTPIATSTTLPPNDLQRSLIAANARRFGLDPRAVLGKVKTRQHAIEFFRARAPQSGSR